MLGFAIGFGYFYFSVAKINAKIVAPGKTILEPHSIENVTIDIVELNNQTMFKYTDEIKPLVELSQYQSTSIFQINLFVFAAGTTICMMVILICKTRYGNIGAPGFGVGSDSTYVVVP